jgi:hypothetical protein
VWLLKPSTAPIVPLGSKSPALSAQCPDYPLRADIRAASPQVLKSAKNTHALQQQTHAICGALFNHLVGAGQERLGDGQSDSLGGLEIDQVKFHRLLDRQVGGLATLENSASVDPHVPYARANRLHRIAAVLEPVLICPSGTPDRMGFLVELFLAIVSDS